MSKTERPEAAHPAIASAGATDLTGSENLPRFIGWLCVECRRCGHRCVFEAGSPPTARPPERLARSLVCRRCGARSAKVHRAPSPRDAQRWRLDR